MNKFPIGPIQDSCTTPDATPVSIATTFLDLLATVVVRAFVVARRPDTMGSKGWQLSAMVKRVNGTCSVEALAGQASPLVSAGDATPMSGCAVSINANADASFSVVVTGLAGIAVNWFTALVGVTVLD